MPYYMPRGGWPSGDTTAGRIAQAAIVIAGLFLAFVFYRKVRDIFRD